MNTQSLIIKGGQIVDPSQGINGVGDVLVQGGKIAQLFIGKPSPKIEGAQEVDATGLIVCPGFIDLHCHLREPGFEDKETIATGTKAAAKGGFTTVCAMGNTNPPQDTKAVVEFVMRKAREEGAIRVLPIGCVTQGRAGKELAEIGELAEGGVVGFSDDGSPVADSRLMRNALSYARNFNLPIIDHCEDPLLFHGGAMNEGLVSARLGLPSVPAAAEEIMVARDMLLAQLTGGHVHIAHVSTAGSVEIIRQAKRRGINVTAEVTPHHLTLTEEWVIGREGETPVGGIIAYDTNTKVNPPLRTKRDAEALLQGLQEGTIDVIATDHAPHTEPDKLCEFDKAAFGISGLETALGSLMALVHKDALELPNLISKLTTEPARLLGGCGRELGTLKKGALADIVLFEPKKTWKVDVKDFLSKGKNTPLQGVMLKGKIVMTLFNGSPAYQDSIMKVAS